MAAIASSRCWGLVAPMIGAVTHGLGQQPGERDLGARYAVPLRDLAHRVHHGGGRSPGSRRARLPNGSSGRPGGARIPWASEPAPGQRAPRDDADALIGAQREHLALVLPAEQVVVVLHADEPGPVVEAGQVQGLAELPRAHRRGADVADLSCPHHAVQRLQRLLDRGDRSPTGGSGTGPHSRCRACGGCRRSRP